MIKNLAIAFVCALMLSTFGAFAMGHGGGSGGSGGVGSNGGGKGRTKIQFNLKVGDTTSGNFFGKFDVSGAMTSNGTSFFAIPGNTMHGKSRNFERAGYDVTFSIGSASFTGTADDKGKVTTPFSAKLTGNGNICQVKMSGLDLQDLLPINTADGTYQVTVEIKLTATKTTTTNGVSTTVTAMLSDQNVTFNYTVKNGRARGKNF